MKRKKPKLKRRHKKPAKNSVCEAAISLGLIGSIRGGPKDLSTNPKHFRDFGKSGGRTEG